MFQTQKVEDYIRSKPELFILIFNGKLAKSYKATTNRTPLNEIKVGHISYVDLRYFGFSWFEALGLPNCDTHNYVVKLIVTETLNNNKKFLFTVPDLDKINYTADPYFFSAWAYRTEINPDNDILLTKDLKKKYPRLNV